MQTPKNYLKIARIREISLNQTHIHPMTFDIRHQITNYYSEKNAYFFKKCLDFKHQCPPPPLFFRKLEKSQESYSFVCLSLLLYVRAC